MFAAQLSGGAGIRTTRRDKFAAEVDGYLKAWKTLPPTVKRITVIRDTPKMRGDTDTCVQQAISAHRRAGRGLRAAAQRRRSTAIRPWRPRSATRRGCAT